MNKKFNKKFIVLSIFVLLTTFFLGYIVGNTVMFYVISDSASQIGEHWVDKIQVSNLQIVFNETEIVNAIIDTKESTGKV